MKKEYKLRLEYWKYLLKYGMLKEDMEKEEEKLQQKREKRLLRKRK